MTVDAQEQLSQFRHFCLTLVQGATPDWERLEYFSKDQCRAIRGLIIQMQHSAVMVEAFMNPFAHRTIGLLYFMSEGGHSLPHDFAKTDWHTIEKYVHDHQNTGQQVQLLQVLARTIGETGRVDMVEWLAHASFGATHRYELNKFLIRILNTGVNNDDGPLVRAAIDALISENYMSWDEMRTHHPAPLAMYERQQLLDHVSDVDTPSKPKVI